MKRHLPPTNNRPSFRFYLLLAFIAAVIVNARSFLTSPSRAAATTLIAWLVAVPIAYLVARFRSEGRKNGSR